MNTESSRGWVVALVALAGCVTTDVELGETEQEVINGHAVKPDRIHALGLVELPNCSGVLLSNSLVLTAGHCLDARAQDAVPVTFEGNEHRSDRVYTYGGYLPAGWITGASVAGIGPDLKIIHLAKPFLIDGSTTGFSNAIDTRSKEDLKWKEVEVFGSGRNSIYGSGEPGVWRSGRMEVTHSLTPLEDVITFGSTVHMQATYFGDSGGPTFIDDGGGRPVLLGIHMSSTVENFCTWQTEHCYSYDTLLAPDFWGITLAMDHAWNYQRTIDVFDVWGAEIRTARFGDLDLDGGSWAHVSRVSNRLCTNRGFIGGHATGHQHGEKTGLACSGPDAYGKAAIYIDARPAELTATGEGFHDVDQVEWAHAARVAKAVCEAHGAKSGYFTGYQNPGTSYGLACVSQNTANLTATWTELDATGWRVDGVVQTGYAQALRAANGFCATRGFRTGFLTGRQTGASYGVTCQR